MPEYQILDGPLEGRALGMADDDAAIGCALTIEVVDVAQLPDQVERYEYRVESLAGGLAPGRLRLVRADDGPGPAAA